VSHPLPTPVCSIDDIKYPVDPSLEKRQLLGITFSKNVAPKQATLLKKLVPVIDEKATREMKMWGPFKLTASNVRLAEHSTERS
jgi:hypothetical protein